MTVFGDLSSIINSPGTNNNVNGNNNANNGVNSVQNSNNVSATVQNANTLRSESYANNEDDYSNIEKLELMESK